MTNEQATIEEQTDWPGEPGGLDLPPRPRRRLLGASRDPRQLAMPAVLLIAIGFIAGVLVEKGQGSSSSSSVSGGFASRLASLRSAAGGGGSGGSGLLAERESGGGSLFAGRGSGALAGGPGAGGATIGQVAYISGRTLYVSTLEGNTVKVTTSAASTVSKTVSSSVHAIHPGETVVVTGSPGANGSIAAESIRVSEAGGFGGGLGGSGGGPALFGK